MPIDQDPLERLYPSKPLCARGAPHRATVAAATRGGRLRRRAPREQGRLCHLHIIPHRVSIIGCSTAITSMGGTALRTSVPDHRPSILKRSRGSTPHNLQTHRNQPKRQVRERSQDPPRTLRCNVKDRTHPGVHRSLLSSLLIESGHHFTLRQTGSDCLARRLLHPPWM